MLRSRLPLNTPTVGTRLNPVFTLMGVEVVLHPLEMASIALENLGEYVDSLSDHEQLIADAIEELLTLAWG